MSDFLNQTYTIINKNFLLLLRNKSEIIKELLVPLITSLFIYFSEFSSKADDNSNSPLPMSEIMNILLPIYLPNAIQGFARRHLITFVHEKQERYKETQKIMGLSSSAYITGWLLTSYIKGILAATLTLLPLYFTELGQNQYSSLVMNFTIYMFASVHQTFAISTLFNSPKLAGEIGTFILSITSLLYYYLTYSTQVSTFFYYVTLLFPQPALSFALTKSNLFGDKGVSTYSTEAAQYMLAFDVILYLGLYFYMDEIIPNEYGISQHPLFFLKRSYWKKYRAIPPQEGLQQHQNYENLIEEEIQRNFIPIKDDNNPIQIEMPSTVLQNDTESLQSISISIQQDTSSARFHQQLPENNSCKALVQMIDLSKSFGKLKAVDQLSLKLYENQIFCLLGHNGAGKTTLISLLTGMIEKTAGNIFIEGKELENNLSDSRQKMGLCTQKDVLYDDMTVTEHLEFIANIKGLNGHERKREIDYILSEVGLLTEKDKQAKTLSGGNKRKLSLGMALTGGSKIIFLDEPTSGMDPVSRQAIWKILEKIRRGHNRCIVLTTHHLDEAEKLANRIAIMSQGKLLILGTSDYIKNKFGIGYNLQLFCRNPGNPDSLASFTSKKQEYIHKVKTLIHNSHYEEQSAKECIKFLLPFESQHQFSTALQALEQHTDIQV